MKLGIFDSGLGGLLITKAIQDRLSDLDMVYLGDTLRVPYGNRSEDTIFNFTRQAMEYLFDKQDCSLIIIACNTASATALRKLQQTWLPHAYPGRNILGVVVPTLEAALERGYKNLGLIATNYTVSSNVYAAELSKLSPDIRIEQKATPLLVPLIENDGEQWVEDVLAHYLAPLQKAGIECLLLGCTHYPFLKGHIQNILGEGAAMLCQDEIVPDKLVEYLARHPEYSDAITRNGLVEFYVTDYTDNYAKAARRIYGRDIAMKRIEL